MSSPPSPELAGRFRSDLEAFVPAPERLGIAVSGGADSLALLLLASAAFSGRVSAATVDHGLRAENAEEAEYVALICAALRVPHAILTVSVAEGGEGVQGEARRARYSALRGWAEAGGIPLIATGHHADDQAETLLMRLQRGSGLSGLSAIRPVRPEGPRVRIVRPLLQWSREDLVSVVRASGIAHVEDPSNADPRFDRAAMRSFLAGNPQFRAERLARSAASLREAEEALEWTASRLWEERVSVEEGRIRFTPGNLPAELVRRILLRILAHFALAPAPRGEEVARLAATLNGGGSANLAGVRCEGGADWAFQPEPPRRASKG